MQIQVELDPSNGKMRLSVDTGTFAEAREAIKELLGYLIEKGIKFDEATKIESHRHTEEQHVHELEGMKQEQTEG